ncbi:MAG TPA: glycosyltransferase family 4 protein [Firmicutes bacterium]|nr:glycosyltransferase family 4 protein [Bacillota bacterium]
MKVGQFTDTFLPVVDGVGRVVSHYAQGLGERCEACYVITPGHGDVELQNGSYKVLGYRSVPLPRLQQYRLGFPMLDAGYRRRLDALQLDIAHAHSPFIAGREALRYARRRGVPLVATFHSKYYDDFYQITHSKALARLGTRYILDFFDRCDQVWAVSPSTAEVLRSYGYRGSIEVVENGMDRKEVDLEAVQTAEAQFALGQKPVLLFVGQMNWKKNIRRILAAVDIVVKQGYDLRLVMVGQGPSEREIRALSSSLGLHHVVIYTGHIQDQRLLQGLYARADLFVFPSLYDNAPMVVREAAAVGTPSLLALGSTAADAVRNMENGLLAKDTDMDMAQGIAWALDHPGRLREIGLKARMTIPRPWKDILAEVLGRYQDLVRTHQSRSLRLK